MKAGAWVAVDVPQLERLVASTHRLMAKRALVRPNGMMASPATIQSTSDTLLAAVKRVWHLGIHIDNVRMRNTRHCRALVQDWEANGYSTNTISNKLCRLRLLGQWIGKPGLVPKDAASRWARSAGGDQ
jgi:site-specific recombinase XerD